MSGKVLIVQRDAQVRKLALVKIEIISRDDALKWVAQAKPEVDALKERATKFAVTMSGHTQGYVKSIDDFLAQFERKPERISNLGKSAELVFRLRHQAVPDDRIEERDSVVNRLLKEINKNHRDLIAEYYSKEISTVTAEDCLNLSIRTKSIFDKLDEEVSDQASAAREYASEQSSNVESYMKVYQSSVRMWMYETKPVIQKRATALSDGDGQFTVKLPPGEYVAMAKYSRALGVDAGEDYYWAVNFVVGRTGDSELILGNQNLDGNHPSCLWSGDYVGQVDAPLESLRTSVVSTRSASELMATKAEATKAQIRQQKSEFVLFSNSSS